MAGGVRRVVLLTAGLAALANAGCLVVAAGAAAGGGAAATALYLRGSLYREYPANQDDAFAAVHAALAELQMPTTREEKDPKGQAYFETRTGDGTTVRVYLATRLSPVPAEGPVTRVSVRVGSFGDDAVSTRVLDQVDRRLAPAPRLTPQAAETAAPPLAR
jgi:hypothetical protein